MLSVGSFYGFSWRFMGLCVRFSGCVVRFMDLCGRFLSCAFRFLCWCGRFMECVVRFTGWFGGFSGFVVRLMDWHGGFLECLSRFLCWRGSFMGCKRGGKKMVGLKKRQEKGSLKAVPFYVLLLKVAKIGNLDSAPDCSGNPSSSPTSPQGERN